MDIVHVFQEEDRESQDGHLEDWFGHEPPDNTPPDAVCACGARLVRLNKAGTSGGVWHRRLWSPWADL
jgi:hypothetical protein